MVAWREGVYKQSIIERASGFGTWNTKKTKTNVDMLVLIGNFEWRWSGIEGVKWLVMP
jgi:hypothetical protein